MSRGGGHAIRHLEGVLIPSGGSLASRVETFKSIAMPILQNPIHTASWRVGATETTAYVGRAQGNAVVIAVTKEGKVLTSFVPDSAQLRIMMAR